MSNWNSVNSVTDYITSLNDDKKRSILAQHLTTLREYAKRLMLEEGSLSPDEEADRKIRMREFWAIGMSLGYAENHLTKMLYRGILEAKPGCDCLICRTVVAQI